MSTTNQTLLETAMDYAEHERTYQLFITMTKWSTVALVALMVFMAVTLL